MSEILSAEQLEALKGFNTPTISNAIELFGVRTWARGVLAAQDQVLAAGAGGGGGLRGDLADAGSAYEREGTGPQCGLFEVRGFGAWSQDRGGGGSGRSGGTEALSSVR